ncbi:PREDICTED: vomeronasal type-1 receptor 4-like [Dipodomys ordii]|uniref:Vomeronasal type-1 receptor n=1 Tax=Dipodomys ordii TaxID=10020 RepID=A0A1S3GSQ3_DIPOR|nr:PREDICTED: vomeronasal type-1 receptor 4-like [Dipodomys ordii]
MILNVVKGTLFLFLTAIGIVGNIIVFVNFIYRFWRGTQKKSTHLILIHLAFANTIILLSKGLPMAIAAFGLRYLLDDIGCKLVVFLQRVAREFSICTTTLLTVVQAITISPRSSLCWRFKPKTPRKILPLFLFFWILTSLKRINLFQHIANVRANTSEAAKTDNYCYFQPESQKAKWLVLILMTMHSAVFQGVMGGAGGYMLLLLHKHHQRVLYLQTSHLHKTLPEMRAAHSVLLLMFCFLFFYWTDCVLYIFLNSVLEINSAMLNIHGILTIGYACLSPFVLIQRDGGLTCCNFLSKRKTLKISVAVICQ